MTHFKVFALFLTFLVGMSLEVWSQDVCEEVPSAKLVNALLLGGFKCQSFISDGCALQECQGSIPNYSRPIRILIPGQSTSLRIHFHGYILGVFPEYEKSLESMVKAMNVRTPICLNTESVVFPQSRGGCKDYDKELYDGEQIQGFIKSLQTILGNNLNKHSLHLSGHSGSGRVIGRFLAAGVKPGLVTYFDAMYSDDERERALSWFKNSEGDMRVISINSSSPANHSKLLMKELIKKETIPIAISVNGRNYQKTSDERVDFIEIKVPANEETKIHYKILTDLWN